eukprot:CAMPEP_0202042360 /NCGR_PEP_ID=MMETSP0962-20130828/27051_1 /ASSEMBLY_ACC=CAM_ASM_000488 /TAXON_ID=4773 /ORGANISM="Schizochytrium aggregatum, Strain ATCC28209" /LENGTH=32 /DNA_ID= /DNA_START= /DNA_END= /DNA_ORIENTATION=
MSPNGAFSAVVDFMKSVGSRGASMPVSSAWRW